MGALSDFYATQQQFDNLVQRRQGNALARQAGGMLAAGDSTGARNALWQGGAIEDGYKIDENDAAARKREAEGAVRVAKGIRAAVQAGHSPGEAYDTAIQLAPQLGIDPAHLQALRPAFEKDPRGFLDMVDAQAQKELQFFQTDRGILAGDKSTGKIGMAYALPGKPIAMDPNKNYYVPDDGSAPAAGAQSAPPDKDAVWQSMIQRESGGRPGVTGPQTRYGRAQGMTQMLPATAQAMAQKLGVPWRPDLMTATTPEGAAYQEKLGRAYYDEGLQKYGGDPAKAAMYYHGGPDERLWGPKTRAYAQAVAPGNLQGSAGSDTVGAIPGYRLVQWGQPKPSENTAVDPNIVKGLVEGRITPPTQKAAATPYWQAQLQAATQLDPTFDGVNFQARAKTRADFTSGKSATNITALNTVVGHLGSLDRAIDGLGNYGLRWNNELAHGIAKATGTDARIRDFETKKEAVANELTRVFRGTGGAEADIQAWKKQLDSANSPEALHTVVQSMAELINSRLEALGEQYKQGMGTTKDPLTLLTPDKQREFVRLRDGKSARATSAPARTRSGATVSNW